MQSIVMQMSCIYSVQTSVCTKCWGWCNILIFNLLVAGDVCEWVLLVKKYLKLFCAKLLYFRILCLSLHTNRVYEANIISTIVDS